MFTFARLLREGFAQVPDPRIERTKLHPLPDILMIALCTFLCGGDSYEHMPEWALLQGEPWLRNNRCWARCFDQTCLDVLTGLTANLTGRLLDLVEGSALLRQLFLELAARLFHLVGDQGMALWGRFAGHQ
jgi:hypothetical protein